VTIKKIMLFNYYISAMYQAQHTNYRQFLPHDSYAKRGICRRRVSVCLRVCVCHTPVLYQNG